MTLNEYIGDATPTLRKAVAGYLLQDDQIMLGMKKVRFGKGKIMHIGGKCEAGETADEALIREFQEELLITPTSFRKVALLDFFFPYEDYVGYEDLQASFPWDMEGHMYVVDAWDGDPTETEEIQPRWYDRSAPPLDLMWDDARFWFPPVLAGHAVRARFTFDQEKNVADFHLARSLDFS